MRAFWRGVGRVLFWSYERMSWPYDVMVVAIVAFVLLAPRSWFHDQPQARAETGIRLLSEDPPSHTRIYRIGAGELPRELRTANATPDLQQRTREILGGEAAGLRGRAFQVVRIEPVLARDGSVQSYDVTVQQGP